MDHVFRRQLAGRSDHRFAGRAPALPGSDGPALFQNGRSAGPMDSAVDAATAQQRAVCGIDDGIGFYFCDVALKKLDA